MINEIKKRRLRVGIVGLVGAAVLTLMGPGVAGASPTSILDTYKKAETTSVRGRAVILWLNLTTGYWHGQITGGSVGDKVRLDYTNVPPSLGIYDSVAASIPANGSSANTSDHSRGYARVCGFVGSAHGCTVWTARV